MAPTEGTLQYIGKVEKMWADGAGKVKMRSRWYYRPHEAKGGRRAVSYRVLACCTCISVQCEEDLENMVLAKSCNRQASGAGHVLHGGSMAGVGLPEALDAGPFLQKIIPDISNQKCNRNSQA